MKAQTQAILTITCLESVFFGVAFLLVTVLMIPVWTPNNGDFWTILYTPVYWAMILVGWLMISFFGLRSFKWDSA